MTLKTVGGSEFIGYQDIYTSVRRRRCQRSNLSVEDVTDKVKMGEQLQAERIRTVGEFAAGMAHEINPIGIISACAECLATKIEADADPAKYVRRLRIIEEESRCSAMSETSSYSPGNRSSNRPVDLTSLVSDAIPAFRAHKNVRSSPVAVRH